MSRSASAMELGWLWLTPVNRTPGSKHNRFRFQSHCTSHWSCFFLWFLGLGGEMPKPTASRLFVRVVPQFLLWLTSCQSSHMVPLSWVTAQPSYLPGIVFRIPNKMCQWYVGHRFEIHRRLPHRILRSSHLEQIRVASHNQTIHSILNHIVSASTIILIIGLSSATFAVRMLLVTLHRRNSRLSTPWSPRFLESAQSLILVILHSRTVCACSDATEGEHNFQKRSLRVRLLANPCRCQLLACRLVQIRCWIRCR